MSTILNNKKEALLLLLLLSVVLAVNLAVFWMVYTVNPESVVTSDSARYEYLAHSLIEKGNFFIDTDYPTVLAGAEQAGPEVFRTPGYPLFIAGIYTLFGPRHTPLMIAQIIFGVGTILLVFLTSRMLFGASVAFLAAIFLAIDAGSFSISHYILSDTLFTFFLVFAVLNAVSFLLDQKRKAKTLFFCGLFISVAALVRPVGYYLIFPIVVGLFVYGFLAHWKLKSIALASIALALPFAVVVGGWQFRNFRAIGSWEISSIKGVHLIEYKAARIIALEENIPWSEALDRLRSELPSTKEVSQAEYQNAQVKKAVPIILKHPISFFRVKGEDFKLMMLAPGVENLFRYLGTPTGGGALGDLRRLSFKEYVEKWLKDKPLQFLISLIVIGHLFTVYLASLISLRSVKKSRKEVLAVHMLLLGVIGYFFLISEGTARFRTPVMPFLAIYGSLGVFLVFPRIKKFAQNALWGTNHS